jgi:hypothetical protein
MMEGKSNLKNSVRWKVVIYLWRLFPNPTWVSYKLFSKQPDG